MSRALWPTELLCHFICFYSIFILAQLVLNLKCGSASSSPSELLCHFICFYSIFILAQLVLNLKYGSAFSSPSELLWFFFYIIKTSKSKATLYSTSFKAYKQCFYVKSKIFKCQSLYLVFKNTLYLIIKKYIEKLNLVTIIAVFGCFDNISKTIFSIFFKNWYYIYH